MSKKYKDLTWRAEGLEEARPGMLAFKANGDDVHHVGIITEKGTVVHASSETGYTTETPLERGEGWMLIAIHRHIEPADTEAFEEHREQVQNEKNLNTVVTIVDSAQNVFVPVGDFRVLLGSLD